MAGQRILCMRDCTIELMALRSRWRCPESLSITGDAKGRLCVENDTRIFQG